MATRRQKICSLLLESLNNISVANGYLTTPDSVSHWKTLIVPESKTKILNMRDIMNEHEDGNGRMELLTIAVDLACKTSTNHTTLTNMIQDVQKAFYSNAIFTIGAALSEYGIYWIPVSEETNLELPNESEIAQGNITMILAHRFYEAWEPDLTVY